jgi:hypothetical protein
MKTTIDRIAEGDLAALDLVFECGFAFLSLTGEPYLQSGKRLTKERFHRLLKLGLLKPNGDSMFGQPSQSFRPTLEDYQHDKRVQKLLSARSRAGRPADPKG